MSSQGLGIVLDPIDPPEGASESEALLYQGRCPECREAAAFTVEVREDDPTETPALTCRCCDFRFDGVTMDWRKWRAREREPMVLATIHRRGRPEMRPPGKGPPVVRPRPPRPAPEG